MITWEELTNKQPAEVREAIRLREYNKHTSGIATEYAQANLAILPKEDAFDFLLFAQRNPKSCPILAVLEPGEVEPLIAEGADIRTDIPKYIVYKDGEKVEERSDLIDIWQDDFVSFLIGCSFSFEEMLLDNSIPIRHIEDNHNVPMYKTNIACQPAGEFYGDMVVSMRPMTHAQAIRAVQVTTKIPGVHGAPVHIGNPKEIGITQDLQEVDFGEASEIKEGEIPVFWACGVTPQSIAMASKPKLMITHAPGHMFVTDLKNAELSVV